MKIFQAKSVNDETPVQSPEPLKIGDVVRLKSGGPLMTVNKLAGEGDVWCLWFDYSDSVEDSKYPIAVVSSGIFPTPCLDVYEPDNKGD